MFYKSLGQEASGLYTSSKKVINF